LTSAFAPATAAGFLSAPLLIASATSMSFPTRATATAIAGLLLLFFGYHLSLSFRILPLVVPRPVRFAFSEIDRFWHGLKIFTARFTKIHHRIAISRNLDAETDLPTTCSLRAVISCTRQSGSGSHSSRVMRFALISGVNAIKQSRTGQLRIGNRRIEISNLSKLLFPGGKFTKAKVIDYYIRISEYLLPHLKNRPVTLKRFPNGVFGEFFYEKDAPAFTPSWIQTFAVPRKESKGPDIRYILISDLPTLVWLTNLANLEIHPFLHRVPRIAQPTSIVFDCDPGEGADILSCVRVAHLLRDLLRDLHLQSFAKVSGSKGLQVYVPLNSQVTYAETGGLAKGVAELLEQREPKLIVSQMAKRLRTNKVLIDWSQNADFKTTVSVYSLRAKTYRPYVSLPMEWDELQDALKKKDPKELFFTPEEALDRVENIGDLFEPVLKKVQKFPRDVREYFEPTFKKRRNLRQPDERKPITIQRSRQGSRRRFVIHKQAARSPHYDLRLEEGDVLKTWFIVKGIPLKKGDKRLAKPAADRPLEYLSFEGASPKREAVRGTLMAWDVGTYELIEGGYRKGFLRFYLNGMKLKGEWTLRRLTENQNERDGDQWQLIKSDKNIRAVSTSRDDVSVLSRRTMKQIAQAAVPRSNAQKK
jgi:bifunctional non-homologous end joining protein LigD